MNKIEHIGIAVKDLEKSNLLYAKLFGEPHYKIEEVKSESVKTSFFKVGNNKIELLEATNDNSAISKFIDRKNKPSLAILKNGSVLRVPVASKIGPLRQSGILAKEGKNYFMFFANPGKKVIPGDKVELTIGDSKSNILIVE